LAGEQRGGGVGEERRELGGVELGADGEERFERGGAGGGVLQRGLERVAHAGLAGKLREPQHFLLPRRARELRQKLRDPRRARLRLQRERGEQAGFSGELLGFL